MSTAETEPAGIEPQVLADLDAVMKRISDGAAVDPETFRRIEERGDRITAEILGLDQATVRKHIAENAS